MCPVLRSPFALEAEFGRYVRSGIEPQLVRQRLEAGWSDTPDHSGVAIKLYGCDVDGFVLLEHGVGFLQKKTIFTSKNERAFKRKYY